MNVRIEPVATMQIFRWFFSTTFLLTAGAQSVLAHPGHGTTEPTTVAHLAEPVHMLPILLAVGATGLIGLLIFRQRRLSQQKQQADR